MTIGRSAGQGLRINDLRLDGTGQLKLTINTETNRYYILLQGITLNDINAPVDMGLSDITNAPILLVDVPKVSPSFYRIESIPISSPLDTDSDGIDDIYELRHNTILDPLNSEDALLDDDQDGATNLEEYTRGTNPLDNTSAPATTFTSSPLNGETGVAVTRETILRFQRPLAAGTVLTGEQLFATGGGRRILSRTELSTDRKTATLFYLENLPASTRVRVTFDAAKVSDVLGKLVDADGDGLLGGSAQIDFDTLSITPVNGTAVIGRVFASELVPGPDTGTNAINRPLQGVTVTVDGAEQTLRAVTDAMGNFTLTNCPAGRFFVHIDGRTATGSQWPNGAYYPFVGKAWDAVAGKKDNLAGGTGQIYLPLISSNALHSVSMVQDTKITFPSEVIAANPALKGVEITVPANTLFSDNGTRGGRVGIAPVPPDRLPGPLPAGLEFALVVTVQTDGPSNFDRPVSVRFPNLPDPRTGQKLPPGEKTALWSFNHDSGEWEPVGSATVTPDGNFVVSDFGTGIRQPGWHGVAPRPITPPPPPSCLVGPCCSISESPPRAEALGAKKMQKKFTLPSPCDLLCFGGGLACSQVCKLTCVDTGLLFPLCWLNCYVVCSGVKDLCKYYCAPTSCPAASEPVLTRQDDRDSSPLTDPVFKSVRALLAKANDLTAQFLTAGTPVPDNITIEYNQLIEQAQLEAGVNLKQYLLERALDIEDAFFLNGEPDGNAPSYPILYKASIVTSTGVRDIRGSTRPYGQYSLFVPANGELQGVAFFDPRTFSYGFVPPNLRPVHPYRLRRVMLYPLEADAADSDRDGLPDVAEDVLGTNELKPDTDGDGVGDLAEISQGMNPLDGLAARNGVIASADTQATAVDICAVNNIAMVADSDAGVSIFNVFAGMNPVRVAQLKTPAIAMAIASGGGLVAVAGGPGGLSIVDVSDPPNSRIAHQLTAAELGGDLTIAVAVAADRAFAGTANGVVSMVEMSSGLVLQQVAVGAALEDLAVEGTTLYLVAGGKLRVFPFGSGGLIPFGSVAVSGLQADGIVKRKRIFVGNNVAYITAYPGYETFDVSNPDAPVRLGSIVDNGPNSFKQIVLNGSGLGLATVGVNPRDDGTHDLYLFDTTSPKDTTRFVTLFETPGIAHAVSIYNGLAYVADGTNGLQVINYLAYDNKGKPPTGSLVLSETNEVSAGGFVVLRAEVQDDVQVRNVEFRVNGQRLMVDGNFPFETVYRVPTNELGQKLNFSAVLADSGGNQTTVTNLPLQVVPDSQPPVIRIGRPGNGETLSRFDDVVVHVDGGDNSGVFTVQLLIDDAPISARPAGLGNYVIETLLAVGEHTVSAIGRDPAGNSARSQTVRFRMVESAISREISIFNFGPSDVTQAASRETSIFNFGPEELPQAVSRELSLFNTFESADAREAISRELSLFNSRPPELPQAISRETSVRNEAVPARPRTQASADSFIRFKVSTNDETK